MMTKTGHRRRPVTAMRSQLSVQLCQKLFLSTADNCRLLGAPLGTHAGAPAPRPRM